MKRDAPEFQLDEAVAEATRARMADHLKSYELAKQLKERGIVVWTTRRRFDWTAVDDATYYYIGDPMGVGRTEQEAIEDLVEQLDERDERMQRARGERE